MRGTSLVRKLMLSAALVLSFTSASGAWASDCGDLPYDSTKDGTYADYAARAKRSECTKDWTVLVYMAADNDLTPYALLNIYEMEAAWSDGNFAASTAKTDLVLELNTQGSAARKRIHVFQSTEAFHPLTRQEMLARTEQDIHSPVVELLDKKSESKSEQEHFQDFLSWAVKNYPSQHYMVVTWGHGQGWAPKRSGHNLASWGGLAFDESDGTKLDTPALRHALEGMSGEIGHPIDVYASDACLMQMVEVAAEISNTASYIVGTDTTESYVGLPYRQILREMNTGDFSGVKKDGESSEALWIARMIPKLYQNSFQPGQPGQDGNELDPEAMQFLTSSALDSEALKHQLVPSLETLGQSLSAYVAEQPLRAIDLRAITRSSVQFEGDSQDLGVFLTLLKSTLDKESAGEGEPTPAARTLRTSLEAASTALEAALVGYVVGSRYMENAASPIPAGSVRAVSLWVPTSPADYEARAKDFSGSLFYRYGAIWGGENGGEHGNGWQSWIEAVYGPNPVSLQNTVASAEM